MKNFKIWFSAFLFVISVFACSGVFKVGKSYSANQYARLAIEKETAEIEKENKALGKTYVTYYAHISEINLQYNVVVDGHEIVVA